MRPGQKLLAVGDTLIDRALCVVGAVLFSQAPEFMQQYLQRLGGHLDEARRQLAHFQDTAAQAGLTLDQLIQRTLVNSDSAVAQLGGVMRDTAARADTLAAAQDALQHATLLTRPFVFLRHLDVSIARGTWSIYQPAVPTTVEGLLYALAGMISLLVVYHFLLKLPLTRLLAPKLAPAPLP